MRLSYHLVSCKCYFKISHICLFWILNKFLVLNECMNLIILNFKLISLNSHKFIVENIEFKDIFQYLRYIAIMHDQRI